MSTLRLVIATATVAAIAVAAAVVAVVATGSSGSSKTATRAADELPCAQALLADWSDGRIDRAYPIGCYRAALKALPADLQVYSSAPDDIARALSRRIQSAGQRRTARTPAG